MFLQIRADAGQFVDDTNRVRLDPGGRTNSRQQQDLRRTKRAGGPAQMAGAGP